MVSVTPMGRSCVLLGLLPALVACSEPGLGARGQAITAGSAAPTDAAVGELRLWNLRVGLLGYCSVVFVTPRAALTAAHCFLSFGVPVEYVSLSRREIPASAPSGEPPISAVSFTTHPAFDTRVTDTDDLAVVRFDHDVSNDLVPLPTRALTATDVGRSLRLVGYGTTGTSVDDGEVRRQATTTLGALSTRSFETPASPGTCHGDSGGAVLGDLDGSGEQLLGIVALSNNGPDGTPCGGTSVHTRVDQNLAWIADELVAPRRSPDGCSIGPDAPSSTTLLLLAALALRRRRRG